jgi:hypothetical protein
MIKMMTGTFVITKGTVEVIQRASVLTNFASGMMDESTWTVHSPIINHIVMLCGFESDSVFVENINQKGWLDHVNECNQC